MTTYSFGRSRAYEIRIQLGDTYRVETQPRISNLLKGEISRFSIDKLINMLAPAGLQVRLEMKPRAA